MYMWQLWPQLFQLFLNRFSKSSKFPEFFKTQPTFAFWMRKWQKTKSRLTYGTPCRSYPLVPGNGISRSAERRSRPCRRNRASFTGFRPADWASLIRPSCNALWREIISPPSLQKKESSCWQAGHCMSRGKTASPRQNLTTSTHWSFWR